MRLLTGQAEILLGEFPNDPNPTAAVECVTGVPVVHGITATRGVEIEPAIGSNAWNLWMCLGRGVPSQVIE
jgi:hypothetical protein